MKMQLQHIQSQSEIGGGLSAINGFGAGPNSMIGNENTFGSDIVQPQLMIDNKNGETGNSLLDKSGLNVPTTTQDSLENIFHDRNKS